MKSILAVSGWTTLVLTMKTQQVPAVDKMFPVTWLQPDHSWHLAPLHACSTHCRTQLGDNIYNQWQSRRRSFSVQSKPFLACKNTFLVTSFLVSDVWLCSRQGHSCRSSDLTLLLSSTLVDSVHNVLTNCWYQDITGMTPPWPWFSVECRQTWCCVAQLVWEHSRPWPGPRWGPACPGR